MAVPRLVSASVWLVALAAVGLTLGVLIPTNPTIGVISAAAISIGGVALYEPAIVPILAMPALVVSIRVGGDSVNLSGADAVLFVAFWFAIFFARRPLSREMRQLLWLSAIYQAVSLFTVVANFYPANAVEWFHAWLLTGGALVVGWAVGSSGRAGLGLGLYAIACVMIAIGACAVALRQISVGSFAPVYPTWPFPMHKNLAGPLMAWAALVAFARPGWLRWPTWFALAVFYVCLLGTLATQSRQALVGLACGMIVIAFRRGPGRPRGARVMLLSMTPALAFVAVAVQSDLSMENPFNSTADRLVGIGGGMEVWNASPWFGAGLRWFSSGPLAPAFQPPNALVETLSSVGVIGLIGFVVMLFGGIFVTAKMDRRFGTLALAIVLTRIVQSQFDQFWVSSLVSVPFVLLGVCVGAAALVHAGEAESTRVGVPPAANSPVEGGLRR